MADEQKLTKKEKKELRKLEWQEKAKSEARNAKFKKYSIWGIGTLVIIGAIAGLVWIVSASPTSSSQSSSTPINVAPVSAKDITNGNTNAKTTLIEYADFQCPACAAYHPFVNRLISDEGSKMLYVYRMFPLTTLHPNSHISAQAAYAAKKQSKFFEMDDLLFSNQTDWATQTDPRSIFVDYAKQLKLNVDQFQTDMNSDEAKNYVNASEKQALAEGMDSTPTFVLNGNKITNPNNYTDFKKLVDDELNKK